MRKEKHNSAKKKKTKEQKENESEGNNKKITRKFIEYVLKKKVGNEGKEKINKNVDWIGVSEKKIFVFF